MYLVSLSFGFIPSPCFQRSLWTIPISHGPILNVGELPPLSCPRGLRMIPNLFDSFLIIFMCTYDISNRRMQLVPICYRSLTKKHYRNRIPVWNIPNFPWILTDKFVLQKNEYSCTETLISIEFVCHNHHRWVWIRGKNIITNWYWMYTAFRKPFCNSHCMK